ncbi:MAG: FAD/NAD(P)-binding protein [Candidatus Eisenbacteria sp.]|jgi:NAD(P)H-flavin reductase|nr:FAD/NAD(P)-binding protein [Candidatus Eisenbacteria bacterium]MCK5595814.1 FAD/NAD(P)-binding protein [Candidatus Eisenbacteria bacterium]
MKNLYRPIESVIEDIKSETPNITTYRFRPKEPISFEAGQFVELTVPGVGEAPFTPSSNPNVTDTMEITIMAVGTVTEALTKMKVGDTVGIRGPYGNGYDLTDFEGKEILIMGGGVGLAPLRSLILALFDDVDKYKKISIRYGARTPEDIIYRDLLPEWAKVKNTEVLQTIDEPHPDWKGTVGVVTVLLDDLPLLTTVDVEGLPFNPETAVACVCGPPIMLKFVNVALLEKGFKPENIYHSMERNMSCGLGKCGHCMMGEFYICKDGPVMTAAQIAEFDDPF